MKQNTTLTVHSADDEKLSADDRVRATLDYIDFMEEITEGLGIETDIDSKLEKLPDLARESGDNLLLKRVDSKIIDHCRKTKGDYLAGLKAIRHERFDSARLCVDVLIAQQEYIKAVDLAEKIANSTKEPQYAAGIQRQIDMTKHHHDQEQFHDQLHDPYNHHGLVYVVRTPDPSFQGAYFLRTFGKSEILTRNYSIIDGFEYIGISMKTDFLLRFKNYEPRQVYQSPELICRLYQMYQEVEAEAKRKAIKGQKTPRLHPFIESKLIRQVPFSEIKDNFNGFSLVAVNDKNKVLLITDPIIRCVRKEAISPP